MTRTNQNFVIAYALLVALPVAGLLGVLKYGSRLQAPVSVDGVWRLQSFPGRFAEWPCGKSFTPGDDVVITISQSGKDFTLDMGNTLQTKAAGAIEGNTLTASLSPSPAAGCGAGQMLQLTVSIDSKAEPRTLAGILSVAGCSTCAPVEFRAVRPVAKRELH
jgi:hypothetical protein